MTETQLEMGLKNTDKFLSANGYWIATKCPKIMTQRMERRFGRLMIKQAKASPIYSPAGQGLPKATGSNGGKPTDQSRRELILRMAVGDGVTCKEYSKASGQTTGKASHHLHTQKSAGLIEVLGQTTCETKTRARKVNVYTITEAGLKMLEEVYYD